MAVGTRWRIMGRLSANRLRLAKQPIVFVIKELRDLLSNLIISWRWKGWEQSADWMGGPNHWSKLIYANFSHTMPLMSNQTAINLHNRICICQFAHRCSFNSFHFNQIKCFWLFFLPSPKSIFLFEIQMNVINLHTRICICKNLNNDGRLINLISIESKYFGLFFCPLQNRFFCLKFKWMLLICIHVFA